MGYNLLLKALTPTITYSPHLKFGPLAILNALTETIKIHKPVTGETYPSVCAICNSDYPCLTIQKIDEQLYKNKGKKWLSPQATK